MALDYIILEDCESACRNLARLPKKQIEESVSNVKAMMETHHCKTITDYKKWIASLYRDASIYEDLQIIEKFSSNLLC